MSTPHQQLEERVRHLEDLEEIRRLFYRYARLLDGKEFDAYVELFTEDAAFVAGSTSVHGRRAIRAMLDEMRDGDLLGDEAGQDFHLVVNPVIEIDGDRATTRASWVYITRSDDDAPAVAKLGHYTDVVVRVDGRWTFQRREAPTDIPGQA